MVHLFDAKVVGTCSKLSIKGANVYKGEVMFSDRVYGLDYVLKRNETRNINKETIDIDLEKTLKLISKKDLSLLLSEELDKFEEYLDEKRVKKKDNLFEKAKSSNVIHEL